MRMAKTGLAKCGRDRARPAHARPPSVRPPKISLFFSLLPPQFILLSLSWGLPLNFCGVCNRDPQMCTFGRLRGRRGLYTTTRELQTCTFEGPGLHKHHQNSTRRHPERQKKNEMGEGEEKERIFGRSGGGVVQRKGVQRKWVRGVLPQGGATPTQHQHTTPTHKLANRQPLTTNTKNVMAKMGLAKVGQDRPNMWTKQPDLTFVANPLLLLLLLCGLFVVGVVGDVVVAQTPKPQTLLKP